MNRSRFRAVHAAAGTVALLCIGVFLGSTLWVELTGGPERVAAVKRGIVYGLALLVPAMVVVGMSGARLGGRSRAASVVTKQRRMRVIAMNGLLVLVPAALILDRLASAGAFGMLFYTVQAAELVAGPVNFVLLGLNFRDGLRMSGRIGRPERAALAVTNRAGAKRERQAAPATTTDA
jgi:hypothetical protein